MRDSLPSSEDAVDQQHTPWHPALGVIDGFWTTVATL
jgi:hypothetical protein